MRRRNIFVCPLSVCFIAANAYAQKPLVNEEFVVLQKDFENWSVANYF